MPDIPIKGLGGGSRVTWVSFAGDYKPGDPPPSGYLDWHQWASVQANAGLTQVICSRCNRHKFPQEIARTEQVEETVFRTKRDAKANKNGIVQIVNRPICLECGS